ncbi:MAG: MBL fold metallo-hydrolase [Longimicrobiales bacterium]|nr:MBL fold metallo-hydrolase [Longimicrobiales bacterium]
MDHPPFRNAGNAGPFTPDGTRTNRIGHRAAVELDPGPDVADHVRALLAWLDDAREIQVVVTHGHRDHAAAAPRLADHLKVPVMGPADVTGVDRPLADGARLGTDAGTLVAVDTPGHAEHHLSFHWEERHAVFVGDLMLGSGDTTWVAEYPGCVADYLDSLGRIRRLAPRVLYPAHGEPLTDTEGALDRYEAHKRSRIRQVEAALRENPEATPTELLGAVYGSVVPAGMEGAARRSLEALVEFVRAGARR